MTPELIRLLGWVDHCSTALPGQATSIPVWLCSYEFLQQAIEEELIVETGTQPLVPRLNMHGTIFGLTDAGRQAFYMGLHLMDAKVEGEAKH